MDNLAPLTSASAPTAHTAPEGPSATARRLNQHVSNDKAATTTTATTTRPDSTTPPPSGILKSRGSSPTSASSPRTNVSVRFNPEAPMFYGEQGGGGGSGQERKRRPQAMPHKSAVGVERPRPQSLPKRGWTYAAPARGLSSGAPSRGGGPSEGASGLDEGDLSNMVSRILSIKAKERRRLDAGHTPRLVLSPGVVHGESSAPDYMAAGGHDTVDEGESTTSESEGEHLEEVEMAGYRLGVDDAVADEDKALTGPLMLESNGENGDFLKGVVDRLEAVEREQREEARFR